MGNAISKPSHMYSVYIVHMLLVFLSCYCLKHSEVHMHVIYATYVHAYAQSVFVKGMKVHNICVQISITLY